MFTGSEESRLARAAARGDGQAFAQLYDSYERKIYNFCLRLVGSKHDAEDATQEAFIKVLGRLPDLTDEELNFGAYLFTAARNASYDVIGKRKKASPTEEVAEEATPMFRERADIDTDPERASMLGAQQLSVQAANALLPERQREVLALREVEEMSYEEIAEVMDSNPNSVAQLISRARLSLRNQMLVGAGAAIAAEGPDCDRALPILAMRQDGRPVPGDDISWVEGHMETCQSCQLSDEAMAEAGLSYRAWLPVAPAAYLFRDTLAKAGESIGSDWSEVARPQGSRTAKDSLPPTDGGSPAISAAAQNTGRRRTFMAGAALGLALLVALVTAIAVDESDSPEFVSAPGPAALLAEEEGPVVKEVKEVVKDVEKRGRPGKASVADPFVPIDSSTPTTPFIAGGGDGGDRESGGRQTTGENPVPPPPPNVGGGTIRPPFRTPPNVDPVVPPLAPPVDEPPVIPPPPPDPPVVPDPPDPIPG